MVSLLLLPHNQRNVNRLNVSIKSRKADNNDVLRLDDKWLQVPPGHEPVSKVKQSGGADITDSVDVNILSVCRCFFFPFFRIHGLQNRNVAPVAR